MNHACMYMNLVSDAITIVQDIEIRRSLSQYTPEYTGCQALISLSCIIYRLGFQVFLRKLNISLSQTKRYVM